MSCRAINATPCSMKISCPKCGSTETDFEVVNKRMDSRWRERFCECGHEWEEAKEEEPDED